MTNRPRLLGLSGSIRRDSANTAILRSLGEALAARADFDIFPLNDIPPYDQDADTDEAPPAVQALRDAIAAADGVIVASPEYNHGMSGVLKNALDWASRPYGKSALIDKPVLTITSSPAFTGGVRAQQQLNETLHAITARVVLRPQTVVGAVHEKVADGRLTDAATLDFLVQAADHLLRDVGVCESLRSAA
jgi:chromate reductase